MPVNLARRVKTAVAAALVAFLGVGAVLLVNASGSGVPRQPAPDVPYQVSSESEGITITVDAASFSGLATLVAARIASAGDRQGVLSARVPEEAFLPGSLVPLSSVGGVPLPVGASSSSVSWRLSPVSSPGPIHIAFNAVDLTVRDQGTVRVKGQWSFELPPPPDLAGRLRVEPLRASGPVDQAGITSVVEAAQRSTTETLVSLSIVSDQPVAHLGQPRLFVDGQALLGTVRATAPDGSRLLLSFPATPFGKPSRLELGPFVLQDAQQAGTVTLDLRSAMARQGIVATPGASGVVDDFLDVISRSDAAPRLLSFEFATSARAGSDLATVGVTLQGNYDDIGSVTAFAGDTELRIDWGESAYRKDPNGVVGEGTTRIFFQLPSGPPDHLVIVANGKASVARGEWVFTLVPE